MKGFQILAVGLVGVGLLLPGLRAQDAGGLDNPYAIVVARNVFGLNPPVVVDPNAKVVEPPVKIVPNGIMSIFGQLQVLFKVPAKPGGKDAAYILSEGQGQDEIEVVKINERAGTVTFNNHGIVQELALVVTPPTSTPMPAAAAAGVKPGIPLPAAPAAAPGNTGNNPFNSRFGNRGNTGGSAGGGAGVGADGTDLRNVPTRAGIYQPPITPQVDPAVTAAQILVNTEALKQAGNPIHKLMPPVPGFSPPPDTTE